MPEPLPGSPPALALQSGYQPFFLPQLILPPPSSALISLDELLYGAVVSLLDIIWEKASRKLLTLPVILYTLAAGALSTARFISAIAPRFVRLAVALFHYDFSLS